MTGNMVDRMAETLFTIYMTTTTEATTTVETYNLTARNGRHIRKATRVRFSDGATVEFTELLPKGEALRQAQR